MTKRIDTAPIDTAPIDLGPLLATDQDAAAMLLLARGQLNRAFRARGLPAPDALAAGDRRGIDPAALDDPAAHGVTWATPTLGAAFVAWTRALPPSLVPPVLEILRRTHAALRAQGRGTGDGAGNAAASVLKAHDFLLAHLPRTDDFSALEISAPDVAAAAPAARPRPPRRAASGGSTRPSSRDAAARALDGPGLGQSGLGRPASNRRDRRAPAARPAGARGW